MHPDDSASTQFSADYSREAKIKCVGVWDTVGALGVPMTSPWALIHYLRAPRFHDMELTGIAENAFHALSIDERRTAFEPTLWTDTAKPGQRVMQVWFPGVHTNVGGGYPDSSLSDVTLRWMAERASECGLELNAGFLAETLRPDPTGWIGNSMNSLSRLSGSYLRPIGAPSTESEAVSDSARERLADTEVEYRPQNLLDYLASYGRGG